jgi:sodium/pantothenate symporter
MIFFSVVFAGFYARISFSDLTINGVPLKMDGFIPAYVVREFPVFVGIVVVLGLISAGISTLEGLIQSISTTATTDIIKPLFGKLYPSDPVKNEKSFILTNKIVIAVFGVISILLSYDQLVNPKLSVAIFAQNGVYAYFSAAFVPILFGMFFKNASKISVIAASVSAIIIHFTFYYGKIGIPFTKATGENPGVAAAMAIIASLIVGFTLLILTKTKKNN